MQEVEQQSLEISDFYKELLPKMQLALKNNLERTCWQRLIDESPQSI